jgi:hypothetical protein
VEAVVVEAAAEVQVEAREEVAGVLGAVVVAAGLEQRAMEEHQKHLAVCF